MMKMIWITVRNIVLTYVLYRTKNKLILGTLLINWNAIDEHEVSVELDEICELNFLFSAKPMPEPTAYSYKLDHL